MLVDEIYKGTYRKSLLNTRMLTYPAVGLKFGLALSTSILCSVCEQPKMSGELQKCAS